MGCCLEKGVLPLLVMEYMSLGWVALVRWKTCFLLIWFSSLYDLLYNVAVPIEDEMLVPMLKDIVSGLNYLHHGNPPVIHADLKSVCGQMYTDFSP